MRFYAIIISNNISAPNLSQLTGAAAIDALSSIAIQGQSVPASISPIPGAMIPGSQWCTVVNDKNNPNALDMDIDIQVTPGGSLLAGFITIYGISPALISQSSIFTNLQLSLYGGFFTGLPLANLEASHSGLLCRALIFPCVGNWVGSDLSITFFLASTVSNPGGPTAPVNIIHNMPKGTPLSQAIQHALSTAFPGMPISVNISPNLILNYDDKGYYQGIEQYQNYVKTLSHSILGTPEGTGYQGVRFDSSKGTINVFDGTSPDNTIQLVFEDLIGQPTWVGVNQMQVKVAMRSDLSCNNRIILPPNILTTTTQAGAMTLYPGMPFNQYQHGAVLNFQGAFDVIGIRHLGRFRNPNAEQNWVTIINAISGGATLAQQAAAIRNISGQQTFTSGTG
jgi:hypothetical protein